MLVLVVFLLRTSLGVAPDLLARVVSCVTPGLHNKIPALKVFARGWVAQEIVFFIDSGVIFSRGWVRKDGNLLRETGCKGALEHEVRAPAFYGNPSAAANLRTKILDFRGFDSSIILILRGDILMSMGNFLDMLSQGILAGITLVGRLGITAYRELDHS